MKIYLDSCSLNRPFDDRSQIRVAIKAEALLSIISLCETGKIELISSEVLLFELNRITDIIRRQYVSEILDLARSMVYIDKNIITTANQFLQLSVKPLDSLHLACAFHGNADYYCTCDDKLYKKARGIETMNVKIVTPLSFIEDIEK